jgi:hypothetical protein
LGNGQDDSELDVVLHGVGLLRQQQKPQGGRGRWGQEKKVLSAVSSQGNIFWAITAAYSTSALQAKRCFYLRAST